MTVPAVLVVAVFLSVTSAAGGDASLTRMQADAIALAALRPQADKGEVILFGLPKPLPAGAVVAPADPPRGDPTRKARVRGQRLTAPAWLYWLDRDPYARFSHESEYLLVDNRTGRVVHRARIGWYPTIGGQDPAFLSQAGYEAARHRVFARVAAFRSLSSAADPLEASTLPAGAFANDCVLMVGDYFDSATRNDFPAVERWAKSVKLRSFYTTPAGPKGAPTGAPPDAAALRASVKELVEKNRCLDILIYMSGHGVKPGAGPPTVMTGKTTRPLATPPFVEVDGIGIDASELEDVVKAFPTTTFKVKVDSCFSGRFLEELTRNGKPRQDNLLILEVSSGANQTSLSRAARRNTRRTPSASVRSRGRTSSAWGRGQLRTTRSHRQPRSADRSSRTRWNVRSGSAAPLTPRSRAGRSRSLRRTSSRCRSRARRGDTSRAARSPARR